MSRIVREEKQCTTTIVWKLELHQLHSKEREIEFIEYKKVWVFDMISTNGLRLCLTMILIKLRSCNISNYTTIEERQNSRVLSGGQPKDYPMNCHTQSGLFWFSSNWRHPVLVGGIRLWSSSYSSPPQCGPFPFPKSNNPAGLPP